MPSETKWTPGPWETWFDDFDEAYAIDVPELREERGHGITVRTPVGTATTEANAHLIAAAPDLYEAARGRLTPTPEFLRWIADRLVHVHGEPANVDYVLSLRERADKIEAALAKARGEAAGDN